MNNSKPNLTYKSERVEACLAKLDFHEKWGSDYLSSDNDKFFELAFDYIVRALNAPKNSTILDAGCGLCAHAARLAKRGFLVQGIDVSEPALQEAKGNIRAQGLDERITILHGNIRSLPFQDDTFSYVLCWGVLMHVPALESSIAELSRVLKPDGIIVIGENNMRSLDSKIRPIRSIKDFLRILLRKKKVRGTITPAGIEYWKNTSDGNLFLYRESNMQWLIEKFSRKGFIVKEHIARQFSELYIRVHSPSLKSLIHAFNNSWFKYVKSPHLSLGNLLILQKKL